MEALLALLKKGIKDRVFWKQSIYVVVENRLRLDGTKQQQSIGSIIHVGSSLNTVLTLEVVDSSPINLTINRYCLYIISIYL